MTTRDRHQTPACQLTKGPTWADPDRQPGGSHHLKLDLQCIWLRAGHVQVRQTAGNQGSSPATNGS